MLHKQKKCKSCGKMFLEIRKSDLCPECMAKETDQFQKVKDYLWDYPGSTTQDISKFTEVPEGLILKWYEDGRLEKSKIRATEHCKICGKPIAVGEICKNCQKEMTKTKAKEEQKKSSMYITGKK
jgi:predicted nucleic acid-binding Zn ribbon protein